VRELARGGKPRLAVQVCGDDAGTWLTGLPGVTVSENRGGRIRLALDQATDPQTVLDAARSAGAVEHFAFDERRLSEVFREAVGSPLAEVK
jgi:ABC-type uncharacterized transport system ATPase subunit